MARIICDEGPITELEDDLFELESAPFFGWPSKVDGVPGW